MAELIYFKDILESKSKGKSVLVSKKREERPPLKTIRTHKVLTAYLMERNKKDNRR